MSNLKYYIPIIVILSANLFTLFAFLVAPYDWSKGNPALVSIYLIMNYLFIYFGYRKGIIKGSRKINIKSQFLFNVTDRQIFLFFLFYLFTFLVKYAYLLRFEFYDIFGMVSYLMVGIVDPQLGYNMSVLDTRPYTVSWSIFVFTSIINQMFFIYGFLVWKQLIKLLKIVFIIFLFIEIFYWFGRGTGFGIISIISNFIAVYFANNKISSINIKGLVRLMLVVFLAINIFGFLKNKRAGGDIDDLQVFDTVGSSVIEDHYIFNYIPDSFVQTYMHSTAYLSQGYFHLGLAMNSNITFTSTYFLGNNPATLNFANILGFDLWDRTYIRKLYMVEGIDDVGKWHSAYLWFANDVSFFGVPFVLFFMSYILGISFVYIINFNDLMSKILFVMLFNMFLYLFSNNTYLYQLFYSFSFISFFWILSRLFTIKFK